MQYNDLKSTPLGASEHSRIKQFGLASWGASRSTVLKQGYALKNPEGTKAQAIGRWQISQSGKVGKGHVCGSSLLGDERLRAA